MMWQTVTFLPDVRRHTHIKYKQLVWSGAVLIRIAIIRDRLCQLFALGVEYFCYSNDFVF